VVEGHRRQIADRVPPGVEWQGRGGGGGHQAQETRCNDPGAGHPVRFGEHRELFEVRDLTEVDLLGQLAARRSHQILVIGEPAARQ